MLSEAGVYVAAKMMQKNKQKKKSVKLRRHEKRRGSRWMLPTWLIYSLYRKYIMVDSKNQPPASTTVIINQRPVGQIWLAKPFCRAHDWINIK